MTTKVNDYDDNATKWQLETTVHRAFGGGWRDVQRIAGAGQESAAATALLPPMAVELRKDENGILYQQSKDLYERRVKLTILTNFYARTALYMTGLVFSGVSWDNVPDKLKSLVEDVDGDGTPATQFFAWQFFNSLISGTHCCYVNTTKPENVGITLEAEDERNGYRVRFSDVPGTNILGGYGDTVRLLANQQEKDGDFGWKEAKRVYVVSPGEVDLYQKGSEDGEFTHVDGYPINTISENPAVFLILGDKIGKWHGLPVLDDLAGIQLDHLRTTSLDAQYREACNWLWVHANGYDLTGGVHSPLTAWTAGKWVEDHIGGNSKFEQYDGKHPPFIKIAEANGNVATFNAERLEEAKNNASLWGMAQLRPDGISFSTATGWNITQKATTSSLSLWAETCEYYIWDCFKRAGAMMSVDVPEMPCILEKDYSNVQIEQLAGYIGLNDKGIISKQTVFNTVKKSGGVETSNDWEEEQEQIIEEGIQSDQTGPGGGVDDLLKKSGEL